MEENPLGRVPGAVTFDDPSLAASMPTPLAAPPPPRQAQQQPQVDPQQMASMADTVHHAGIGKAFRSLMGNEINYSVGPDGKLVSTETPRSGSNLWRSMLAGVLLGGATASKDGAKNFIGGAAEGGAAVVQHGEQQDAMKRAQAQEGFKDQLAAQANQRANKAEDRADKTAASENTLRQAQVAMHNAHTLHENQLMQREDYTFHEEVASKGKVQLQPFIDAGLPYAFKDKGEGEMNDLIKNNPDAAHLLWEPTGTRVVVGSDGKPNVEATYSAVNPTGKIKLTDAQINQFKEAGIDQYYGKAAFDVLKKDKELDANQYMALTQKEQELTNKKNLRNKQDLDLQKEKAAINLSKAETSHFNASSAKLYQDISDKKLADQAFAIAIGDGDFSKIPLKDRAKSIKLAVGVFDESIKTDVDVIKSLPKDASGVPIDQNAASSQYKQIEKAQKIRNKLLGVKEDAAAPAAATGDKVRAELNNEVYYIPKDKIDKFLESNPDAKTGEQSKISPAQEKQEKLGKMLQGSAESFENGPPSLDTIREDKALFTNNSGKYIIRETGFNNSQWKKVGDGKIEMPLNVSGG